MQDDIRDRIVWLHKHLKKVRANTQTKAVKGYVIALENHINLLRWQLIKNNIQGEK